MIFAPALVFLASLTIRGVAAELQQGKTVTVAGERICAENPLPAFYEQRGFAPAWMFNDNVVPAAGSLIEAIEHAGDHGLNPSDYHLDAIRRASGEELDLLLTDAFLLLATQLNSGRVNPVSMEPTWCLPARSNDLPAALEYALDTGEVHDTLEQLAPATPQYRRMQQELARLRAVNDPHVRQVELNLERLRWLPPLGGRYALVNIPAFRLSVIETGRAVLTMRIVVGQVMKKTPVFSTSITQVIFNPSWYLPESIADAEYWPRQRRDSSFFAREHIEVLPGGGLRQLPGPWNALGRIKFNMPNEYSVYLHDTPSRRLFQRSVRTFSHGCIRLEKPMELARYLLGNNVEAGEKEHAVDVIAPLPVHILYWTAFIDDDGKLQFAPDVYGRDSALDRAMQSHSGGDARPSGSRNRP